MIIWLASYPRSGNSLLSSVIFQCLGIPTFTQYPVEQGQSSSVSAITGQSGFFPEVQESGSAKAYFDGVEHALLKTHEYPSDNHPAIYIVRDGRQTLISLLKFEREINSNHDCSLLQLILGDTYFGSWTDHFRSWHQSKGRKLLTLRFEDVVKADDQTVDKIAKFIGHEGERKPFCNPFSTLTTIEPQLFQTGSSDWIPTEEWTAECDYAFWSVHGQLMRELGFRPEAASGELSPDIALRLTDQLLRHSARISSERRHFEQMCMEKEKAIKVLSDAADERAQLIKTMHENNRRTDEFVAQHSNCRPAGGGLLVDRLLQRFTGLTGKA
jgi:hypothetical protein